MSGTAAVGFFSFTEVTDATEHRAYNAWHQLDHMPEQFRIPGVIWGQRWVSTPACRAARAASGPLLDPIHYVTLYLMTEPVDETLRAFYALGQELHDAGRWHHHRRAHLSGPFRVTGMHAAPRVEVSAAVVPYRPNRGVYVVVAPLGTGPAGDALAGVPGVAGAWSFTDETRSITVAWCDDDPIVVAPQMPGANGAFFAGPFTTITPWEWGWFDAVPAGS